MPSRDPSRDPCLYTLDIHYIFRHLPWSKVISFDHARSAPLYLLTRVHVHVHTCTIRAHTCLCHGTRQLLLRSQPGDNLLCCVRMCHGMTVAPHLNQLAWHQPADGRPDGSACMTHASFTQMSSDVTPPFPFLGDRLPKVPVRRLASQPPFRSEGQ